MGAGWFQGEDIWKFWWMYLIIWVFALFVLLEKKPQQKQQKPSWEEIGQALTDNLRNNLLREENDPKYKGKI